MTEYILIVGFVVVIAVAAFAIFKTQILAAIAALGVKITKAVV